IFVDVHLWRELKVKTEQNVTRFNDDNLEWEKRVMTCIQNKGYREATGEALKTVIVPYKLIGQTCDVQDGDSEVPWYWKQFPLFGVLNH
ncbi:hypothetical protein, partial [Pseudoalteromonas sp. S1649]|uniref:hypothetical protein n=1 Tax=Pseudoalteromonas sp. S1649 TaxID=579508 RepID=UPI0012832A38